MQISANKKKTFLLEKSVQLLLGLFLLLDLLGSIIGEVSKMQGNEIEIKQIKN